jgi:hypothetical protein
MADSKKHATKRLVERMVRNDDIFCSLLFDHQNRTIRVIDFRGGNFQTKHNYLERVLMAEGMRKIFTLIERDDMNGWQRVGYIREGTIPGYYKRSDAYIMSRIYDEDWDSAQAGEDLPERKNLLGDVKGLARGLSELKGAGVKTEQVTEEEALKLITVEIDRLTGKPAKGKAAKKGKGAKGAKGAKGGKAGAKAGAKQPVVKYAKPTIPVFKQFSRETDCYYFMATNRRTKGTNVFGAEYQDCFGNAKVDIYFSPVARSDRAIARQGLISFIDWLAAIGAVAVFSLVSAVDVEKNAIYASAGFRNSGWMNRQLLGEGAPKDQILWTRKLT